VMTKSGVRLSIYFDAKEGTFYNIYLEGDARIIYKGEMSEEAMHYVSAAIFTEETVHDEN